MSKPTHVARYYADDKDVFDLLSQATVSLVKLRAFLRTRGIVLSPSLTEEEISAYLPDLPICPGPSFVALLAFIETPDREDNFSTCRLADSDLDIQNVITAALPCRRSAAPAR